MYEEDIFTDIDFLTCLAKSFGFISSKLKLTKTNRKYLVHQTWHYVLCIVFHAAYFVCGYINFRDFCEYNSKVTHGRLFIILNVVSEFIFAICGFVCCICSKTYTKKNQRFWEKLYNIEIDMRRCGILVNHKFLKYINRGTAIITLTFAFFLFIFFAIFDTRKEYMNNEHYVAKNIYYFYNCLSYGLLNSQCITTLVILNELLSKLEKTTREIFENNEYGNCRKFLKITKYHQRICQAAREGNNVVSIQLAFVFMELFCLYSAAVFSSTVAIINNTHTVRDIVSFSWIITSSVATLAVIILSHKCTDKVCYSLQLVLKLKRVFE